ncbi:MAG: cell wall-binding repeat-containing protein, partial [Catenulispora sp.]
DGLGTKDSVQTQSFTVTVSATGAVTVNRAAGTDRYDTGLIISQHQWADKGAITPDAKGRTGQAKAVVLSTGNAFPDALAGVPLAKKANGPLLLTDGMANTLNPAVLAEIQRILPTKDTTVYVLGGEKAISAGIESQLTKLGFTVKRLAGADRYATALTIAKEGMGDPSHVIVARGDEGKDHDGFADALAAGPYAANVWGHGNSAVVLSNFKVLDPNTAAYVGSKIKADQLNVAAVGGQAVAAVQVLPGAVQAHQDSTGKWVGTFGAAYGPDRYATAQAVAAAFRPAGERDRVGVATGLQFPDALTGGAYMATIGGPLLLTDPKALPAPTLGALVDVAGKTPEIDIFGGSAAVSDSVAKAIAAVVKVTAIGKF